MSEHFVKISPEIFIFNNPEVLKNILKIIFFLYTGMYHIMLKALRCKSKTQLEYFDNQHKTTH